MALFIMISKDASHDNASLVAKLDLRKEVRDDVEHLGGNYRSEEERESNCIDFTESAVRYESLI